MEKESRHHGECRLQMEAQRISLSQIHAAQLELLQEESSAHARSLERRLQDARGPEHLEETTVFRFQNLIRAVTDESNQIFQAFHRILGEDLSQRVDTEDLTLLEERPETRESASILHEAGELCRVLLQVKEQIEAEHRRLSQLQDLLRAEGNKIIKLQTAYDDLKTSSENETSPLHRPTSSAPAGTDLEAQTDSSSSSSCVSEELRRLKADAQEKQLRLEERHRLEMERLRSHFQQRAAETEERYATELFMLQRRLQEVTEAHGTSESSLETENREVLKDLSEAELLGLSSSPGLTGQLQTLRTALYNKYVQEVAALKEQHSHELRRLREEQRQDLNGVLPPGSSVHRLPEEEEQQLRLQEEVAKAIVQMSVEFAQKAELTRMEKQVGRSNASIQTQPNEEEQEMEEEQTPRASPSDRDWLEEERGRLERELEERSAEVQRLKEELEEERGRLKEELQKTGLETTQPLMKTRDEVDGSSPAGGARLSVRDDGESSDADRCLLQTLNQQLSQELLDVLKTTAAAEETLQLHVQSWSAPQRPVCSGQRGTRNRPDAGSAGGGPEDVWSGAMEDEGLEGSRHVTDGLGFGPAPQNQEALLSTSGRLQTALEKMLTVITDTTNQLEHARITQTELMRESFRHNQEIGELLEKQEELQERLSEEARAREQLAVELQRAEGLIDGYTDERASLEEQLRQKEELQRSLEEELQLTSSQLQELERDRRQLQGERDLLSRQQDAMREEAGPRELCLVEAAMVAAPAEDLLEETEKLMKEKVEVQRQAEKENTDLLKQVKLLEAELEEQVSRVEELKLAQTTENGDLRQQVQALEKQLEKNRKFLDEQAVDREHERDVFQQEIQKLEQQLRSPQKIQAGSEQRNREVEQLTAQLKEKADWCSELLLGGEQLRRELGERDQEIDKLESRVRELETALLASAETLQKAEHKKHHAPPSETRPPPLEAQLQTEREAVERKEKEICNLEEQLEQFKEELENKSEEVQQLHMQLEIQRKEMSSQQQFLQSRESMLQVMQQKDREIELLTDQISKLQQAGSTCENQDVDERDELLKELESQVEYLRSEQERLKRSNEDELEQLNEVIEKLQQELANLEPRTAAEEDEEQKKEPDADVRAPSREDYEEMKQKKDRATKELDALRTEHGALLDTYRRLKDGAEALAQTEHLAGAEEDLEEALREKTAGLVVLQAQVQALEQSAASRLQELEEQLRPKLWSARPLWRPSSCSCKRRRLQGSCAGAQTPSSCSCKRRRLQGSCAGAQTSSAARGDVCRGAAQERQTPSSCSCKRRRLQGSCAGAQTPSSCSCKRRRLQGSCAGAQTPSSCKRRRLQRSCAGAQTPSSCSCKRRRLQGSCAFSADAIQLQEETSAGELRRSADAIQLQLQEETSAGELRRSADAIQLQLQEETTAGELRRSADAIQLQEETSAGELRRSADAIQLQLQEETIAGELRRSADAIQLQLQEETIAEELRRSADAIQLPSFPLLGFSGARQALPPSSGKVAHLTQTLRDLEAGLSGIQRDQELQKELLSSSEEEVNQYERRLAVLMDLLSGMRTGTLRRTSEETSEPPPSHLLQELQEVKSEAAAATEQLQEYQQTCSRLQQDLREKSSTIQTLQIQMQQNYSLSGHEPELQELKKKLLEAESEAAATKEELSSSREGVEKLQELLQEREMTIAHLRAELLQVKASEDGADVAAKLQEVRADAVSTKEELRGAASSQLQELRRNVDVTKEELSRCRQKNEALLEELRARERSICSLKEQLQEVQTALVKATESGSPSPSPQPSSSSSSSSQPKRKGGKHPSGKASASRKNSAGSGAPSTRSPAAQPGAGSEQQPGPISSFTQTEAPPTPEFRADKEEVEEVIAEFQEKIDQMQELHAAEILDMEARHIAESESLRRDLQALEDESKALKGVIDRLRSEAPASRQDRSAATLKDGYASDSSSDYSQRTGYELLQQEFRTTPEGAQREAEDPLPDRIKSLIREVHQEGMQVLSLSELPLSEGEPGRHGPAPGWLKERDALLATLESLKAVIAQMQTQTACGADWRADLLDAVRQVFMRERSVLKNAGVNQLGLLDTNDAVVHLNQLELRLAEQDAQHRDAMASLLTAERASLLSEIQQLQSRLRQEEGGGHGGERPRAGELEAELRQTKLELEAELKVQQKHLKELEGLRAALSQKAGEVEELNEQLMEERKRSRDLQWAVEKETCRSQRDEENKREEVEDLQLSLEEQRSRVLQLEEQQQTSSALQRQTEQEHLRLRRQLQELQVQLDTERAKAEELTSALGRERERRAPTSPDEERAQEERLQRELDEKHAQVVHLLSQVEAHKLKVVQIEEELTLTNQKSQHSQEVQREAEVQLQRLEAELTEVQEHLRTERDRRRSLEERLDLFEGGAQAVQHKDSTHRTQDWVLQQRTENAPSGTQTSPQAEVSPSAHAGGPSGPGQAGGPGQAAGLHHGPWRTVDKIVGKLQLVSSRIHNLSVRNTSRSSAEVDMDELSWIQSNVDDVLAVLQRSPGLPPFPEILSPLAGGTSSSSNALTERLLRQNAELTGFVSRLTEEKNDLRNHSLRLEEELRRYRQAGFGSGYSSSRRGAEPAGSMLSQEREAWSQEKIRLEKALLLAQSQISRLRGEIRSNAVREITGPEADNAALKRMYGRYLRAESFRKALIYQKKYLLLLLGFQECEEATLFLLTRMGGRPSLSTLDPLSQRRRGLTRFRSAVRVAIALSRMRFLVKRWHRAAGMSSAPSSKNGAGVEVRDSSFLHVGGADAPHRGGGEGLSGSRGRSGSPRSGGSSSHHRFHAAADHAALTCSHLQSYDPDRALSDYISRLEALQRRLGSVASGSSSYAQTHHGLRR
ncbi:hypothetical protein OJAV_G00115680 [Oryzias javanicus]|uniref:Pericentrin/AKAP-450 centrosomal targeting domain-containing protein n=1 Tax=Oryzias javanicus TaxID=123683 RepID=A0A437CXF3_ORYJA|nr:hypothetical protein OJAV_G00115680 [Oryzias javanicus]